MARSILFSPTRLFAKLGVYDTPSRPVEIKSEPEDSISETPLTEYTERPAQDKKRKRISDDSEIALKKPALSHERSVTPGPDAGSSNPSWLSPDHTENPASTALQTRSELDRSLMPPPPNPRKFNPDTGAYEIPSKNPGRSSHDDDDTSLASLSAQRNRPDEVDQEDEMRMEAARRYAAAITLPESSGAWSEAERDLFFHIAYRGFEPLIPSHWREFEFGSFPINLFASIDSTEPPLLRSLKGPTHGGSRALAMLVQAGLRVEGTTDRYARQRTLQRYTLPYLKWALMDVGIRSADVPGYIPIHVWTTCQHGQSTLQTLERMAKRLHKLSEKHQSRLNLQPSVESDVTMLDDDTTRVIDSDSSASLPTLFGIVLISSVISIVTLNPYQLQQNTLEAQLQASAMADDDGFRSTSYLDRARLRIITELDFSRKEMNIWNALGFAIVCMSIRKEAVKTNFGEGQEGLERSWKIGKEWELTQPDPDA